MALEIPQRYDCDIELTLEFLFIRNSFQQKLCYTFYFQFYFQYGPGGGIMLLYVSNDCMQLYLCECIDEYSMMSHCQGNAKIGV